jgi:hypothetical protein
MPYQVSRVSLGAVGKEASGRAVVTRISFGAAVKQALDAVVVPRVAIGVVMDINAVSPFISKTLVSRVVWAVVVDTRPPNTRKRAAQIIC